MPHKEFDQCVLEVPADLQYGDLANLPEQAQLFIQMLSPVWKIPLTGSKEYNDKKLIMAIVERSRLLNLQTLVLQHMGITDPTAIGFVTVINTGFQVAGVPWRAVLAYRDGLILSDPEDITSDMVHDLIVPPQTGIHDYFDWIDPDGNPIDKIGIPHYASQSAVPYFLQAI